MSEEVPVLVFRDDGSFGASVEPTMVLNTYPTTDITFCHEGKEVVLTWKTGKLDIVGDVEESAKLIFETFLKPHVDSYIKDIMPYDNLKYLEWCAAQKDNNA